MEDIQETIPHPENFCGGNFQDWIEVMLTSACNGKCSFCIEKNGFKPKETVSYKILAEKIISTGKMNVLLLGGEPTLYPDLNNLIALLKHEMRNVYMTTNGGKLMNLDFIHKNLSEIDGVNISIHHYDLKRNKNITGIDLSGIKLAIARLHEFDIRVRINCNCIAGEIDSESKILGFIGHAIDWGADGVRFAELKNDDRFVDLAKILNHKYGLNDDPFRNRCFQNATICGMPVNFRQLCGMQTFKRPQIINPKQILKDVLYYDGKIYSGWQKPIKIKEDDMSPDNVKVFQTMLKTMMIQVKNGEIAPEAATRFMMVALNELNTNKTETVIVERVVESVSSGSGCVY